MKIEDLLKLHKETCSKALATMRVKNHDYTSGSNDPFANFRGSLFIGIEPELGILMRCMDKFKRIQTFVEKKELKVKDESVMDAIEDTINYMILLKGIIKEKQNGKDDQRYK